MSDFDVLVLGSGPGGQKAAIAAAKLGRKVGLVERRNMIGGVCINTGTIPSKTLREAVLYLTGMSQRELYGQSYRVKDDITISDLTARTSHVVGREVDVIRNQLARNHITVLPGMGRFRDEHTILARVPPSSGIMNATITVTNRNGDSAQLSNAFRYRSPDPGCAVPRHRGARH